MQNCVRGVARFYREYAGVIVWLQSLGIKGSDAASAAKREFRPLSASATLRPGETLQPRRCPAAPNAVNRRPTLPTSTNIDYHTTANRSIHVTAAMATLAAHDQENAVRNIAIGPSGKPMNAGIKGLGAKTPGNKAPKTPFKIPLNDENVFKQAGKANGKGAENLLKTSLKGGKLDENAFITPAGK